MSLEFVAHRAGNSPEKLRAAEGHADIIEVDVHRGHHGHTEVRHAKVLWPTRRLWERWYVLPADHSVSTFDEIIAAAGPTTALWLDLKGVRSNIAPQVIAMARTGRPIVVSTKSWWLLAPYAGVPGVRTFRSAGNRLELALLRWLPSRVKTTGAVVNRKLLTDEMISLLKANGELFTWNVNDQATVKRLAERGLDGLIVDDIGLVGQG